MAAILEYDVWIGDTLGRGEELDGWWIGSCKALTEDLELHSAGAGIHNKLMETNMNWCEA